MLSKGQGGAGPEFDSGTFRSSVLGGLGSAETSGMTGACWKLAKKERKHRMEQKVDEGDKV